MFGQVENTKNSLKVSEWRGSHFSKKNLKLYQTFLGDDGGTKKKLML
jgi:hypothetical protein